MKRVMIFLVGVIFLSSLVFSLPVFPPATCSEIWGADCGEGPPESFDNTFDNCNYGTGNMTSINEIYLDKSSLFIGDAINVTCNVLLKDRMKELPITTTANASATPVVCRCDLPSHLSNKHCAGGNLYIYYRSPTSDAWTKKYSQSPVITCENYSVSFIPDLIDGEHQVRCILGYENPESECGSGTNFDNDDANFTVYSEFISITLSNTPINFGEVDMNTTKEAINNPLIISVDSNVNFDITTKANGDFSNSAGYIFPASNMKWAIDLVSIWNSYTTDEAIIYSNQVSGIFNLFHNLFIPSGQRAGTYSADVVITAKKHV